MAALQRLTHHLDPQPLMGGVLGRRQVLPHAPDHVAGAGGLVAGDRLERLLLLQLEGPDDLHDEPLLAPEVVDQHAVAGAQGGRQLPQAGVAQTVLGDVVDGGVEQALAGGARSTLCRFTFPCVTCPAWYICYDGKEPPPPRPLPTIDVPAGTPAPPATTFRVLGDAERWPDW